MQTPAEAAVAIAASYAAKAFGIKTGTLVREARWLCPDVIPVQANHRLYFRWTGNFLALQPPPNGPGCHAEKLGSFGLSKPEAQKGLFQFRCFRRLRIGDGWRAALVSLALSLFVLPAPAQEMSAQMRIIDGDTLAMDGARIRLWGIDAPRNVADLQGEGRPHL